MIVVEGLQREFTVGRRKERRTVHAVRDLSFRIEPGERIAYLMLLLQATLTTAGGLAVGLMSNARRIGAMALDGDLDAVLALPTSPLGHLLLRRIDPIFRGDIVFGIVAFAVAGVVKVLLFTVVPAVFVAAVPARLVRDFDLGTAAALLTAAIAFTVAGSTVFRLGRRRYTSGAVWTRS